MLILNSPRYPNYACFRICRQDGRVRKGSCRAVLSTSFRNVIYKFATSTWTLSSTRMDCRHELKSLTIFTGSNGMLRDALIFGLCFAIMFAFSTGEISIRLDDGKATVSFFE